MQNLSRQSIISIVILSVIACGIHLYASLPEYVETLYSSSVYPFFSSRLRILLGSIPFSTGDVLYILLLFVVSWKLVQWIKRLREEKARRMFLKMTGLNILRFSLLLYICFNLFWGLNYNRKGIHDQLGLERGKYAVEDLLQINHLLLDKVNECKTALLRHNPPYPSGQDLFTRADQAFTQAAETYPFLQYRHSSVKPSLFNFLGNYFGFSGYYNPFTGEAQVNTDIPGFLQPYVSCHEISHQLGYAKENEANFAGYIAATGSGDSLFMYSAYFELFLYANRNLYTTDSIAAKEVYTSLLPGVKADIKTLKAYYKKYENPVEPVFRWIYGKYLQANDQPAGMVTYSEVVADVIAWHKKYGKPGG
ncbi:MAG: DUF3810 domain-containing protein [Chitinophagaceae bacterium]|nr:DUF3810 domain-containing protein [Chitinophagaceae bacterium]